jgi:hypothetical protein
MHRLQLFLFLLLAPLAICAQERARPVQAEELWTSFSISGRPPKFFNDLIGKETRKKFRLGAELGRRSNDNFYGGRQILTDLSIRYSITDSLSIGVEHRYSYRPDQADRQRSGIAMNYERPFGKLKVDYRLAFQHTYQDISIEANMLRNRVTLEYNFPKWKLDPIAGVEFFSGIGPYGLDYVGTRYRFGTKIPTWKGHEITVYGMHDRERNVAWPDHRFILSVDYSINFTKL